MDSKGPPVLMTKGQPSVLWLLHQHPEEKQPLEEGGSLEGRLGNNNGSRNVEASQDWRVLDPCGTGGLSLQQMVTQSIDFDPGSLQVQQNSIPAQGASLDCSLFLIDKNKTQAPHSTHELPHCPQDGHFLRALPM